MRWALHLLVAMAVLMCGLHIGEAEAAHEEAGHHQLAPDGAVAGHDGDASPDKSAKLVDAGHHHCPIALDQPGGATLCAELPEAILVARPVAAMASLAQAPPFEPPLA